LPDWPLLPPGLALISLVPRFVGAHDPRLVVVFALVALAGILAARFEGRRRRSVVAVALLSAPLALGTVLGAPVSASLAAVVGAWAGFRAGHDRLAGVLAGLAVALDHRMIVVVPFALLEGARPRMLRAALAAGASYLALVVPVVVLDVPAFLGRAFAPVSPAAGLGVANLLAYRGAESVAGSLWPLTTAAALGATVWLLGRPWSALARAGVASLVAIVLAPAVSANAVAVPMLLLTLAVVDGDDRDGGTNRDETETKQQPGGLD
jgi:MFS family permease